DCGQVEVSLDGGIWKTVELYHRFSRGLHYPRTVMLFTDLEAGDHQLRMRVSENRHPQSKGHAIRVLRLGVNE
ncbi:MAG: SGNH/GDSL hydrolase family protein, partial [Planctomycetota bacterium]|nr:SGNH/GDSL hydrolase family protein [Planctomycetota bacterium]